MALKAGWALTAGLSWFGKVESCHSTGVQVLRILVAIAAKLSEIFPCVFILAGYCTNLAGKERVVKVLYVLAHEVQRSSCHLGQIEETTKARPGSPG